MLPDHIAQRLHAKGYDVISPRATDPALVGLPDQQVLACATTQGRALVTAIIQRTSVPAKGHSRHAAAPHASGPDPGL